MTWLIIGSCVLFGFWLIRQTRKNLFKSEGVTHNLEKHPAEFAKPTITYVASAKAKRQAGKNTNVTANNTID